MNAWDDEDEWADDDSEGDSDDDEATLPCPYCRRAIHEDAQRCPYCEHYISEEDRPETVKPLWLVVGVVVCLALVLLWIVM
jgi:hypothetical protein